MAREPIYKAEGIILKRRNVGETDRIVTIFTKEYGKIRVIAKGIRRIHSRRAPYLEIFSQVKLIIHHGRLLDSVSEVEGINDFHSLKSDLRKVSLAYLVCELVDTLLAERQEHRDVFELMRATLAKLEENKSDPPADLGRHFALELLWLLGFLPRGQVLTGRKLQDFIENLAEKHLRTPKLIRQLFNP